ncbi:HAMP domain-containing sensor histidine kinase [Actimicrobium sp. CCI2.3]|uniref:sensor histidine kinase n=1 Tax=Actimicrobium sp. CCI2.3 TaxID=3048616 RepID=UPI002AB4C9F4|nr:HAMP domain-containing sensor histidine kinase [Actimicrobium sp. CCI2.3]MDY7574788.1 HAMP domain-containing sensor histidine kinase [Actimicrobium sp. CCI2.3]MEB0020251.1 HAMP domain-containing sensor histidine kinase [Actimicrobium sp. CCI2.3]
MMHEFLMTHRAELERRCREKVSSRPGRSPNTQQLEQGIPMFLDQLIRTLQAENRGAESESRALSGPSSGDPSGDSDMAASAAIHGADLLTMGYSIDEVVHDYGDLCQAVSDLSIDLDQIFTVHEFRTLNRCLDNGIAGAVAAFSEDRDLVIADRQALETNERLGFLAHELRNHLNTAMLALAAIKTGNVGLVGPTGSALDRSLVGLRRQIDRSLAEVRIGPGMTLHRSVFSLANFIKEIKYSASLEADLLKCGFHVEPISPLLSVDADKDLLFSALGNLLQNAFKFSGNGGVVTLSANVEVDRVRIKVKDNGPGLSEQAVQDMFLPFTQGGSNRSGLGLGLSIARRSVEANGGLLTVESTVGQGCLFIIDLPDRSVTGEAASQHV